MSDKNDNGLVEIQQNGKPDGIAENVFLTEVTKEFLITNLDVVLCSLTIHDGNVLVCYRTLFDVGLYSCTPQQDRLDT